MEITGNSRRKIRNAVKNKPKLPTSKPTSASVGEYMAQLDGRKSRCREVTMITNRSNHMPIVTRKLTTKIQNALVRQAYGPVRWVEVVQALSARGVDRFVEFGPGKVLVGLVKRIAPQARTDSVHDAASLAQTLESFK